MPEHTERPDDQIEHPEIHREHTDAKFKPIFFILVGAVVFAVVVHVAILLFLYGWRDHERAVKRSPFPLAPAPASGQRELPALPPGQPRLEQEDRLAGNEAADVYERQRAKEEVLHSSGPTDDPKFVHIPIDQAMKRLENNLPHRAAPSDEEVKRSNGLIDAGESNSGREFKGAVK